MGGRELSTREVYHVSGLAHRLLKRKGNKTLERSMAAIEKIRTLAIDNGWSSAFANGFSDGQTAREQHRPLTAYVRVGIDDYAKGYRQGFFDRTASAAPSNRTLTRQVAGL